MKSPGMDPVGESGSLDATIAHLEQELPILQTRRQALQNELRAVSEHENAIIGALNHLRVLSQGPGLPAPVIQGAGSGAQAAPGGLPHIDEQVTEPQSAGVAAAEETPRRVGKKARGRGAAVAKAPAAKTAPRTSKKAVAKAPAARQPSAIAKKAGATQARAMEKGSSARSAAPSGTTTTSTRHPRIRAEDVLRALADAQRPLKAAEVAAELAIEEIPANIHAIRSHLERLARVGRVQRAARGLYIKHDS